MKGSGTGNIRTFLFSLDNPWHYMYEGTLSPQPWPSELTPKGLRFQPEPGLYAISVNLLTGALMPDGHEDYLAEFRHRTPQGYAGYSILIYKVD